MIKVNFIFAVILMIFVATGHCVTIDCTFVVAEWHVIPIGNVYNCWSRNAVSSGNLTIIEELHGSHLIGKSNGDVLLFREDGNLQYVPTNLVDIFPNLKGLLFYESPLLRLLASDLEPFPNLVGIFSRGGQFTSIEGDLFQHTKKLKRVELQVGKLQNVGENILSGLNELTEARFVANTCIYFIADTPEKIQELIEMLLVKCPPLGGISTTTPAATTTVANPNECSVRCSLEDEFDELRTKVDEQNKIIDELNTKVIGQAESIDELWEKNKSQDETISQWHDKNARQEERLVELEMMIREINARP